MDYISLLTGMIATLVGTLIAGVIGWFNLRSNLNRQFKHQQRKEELQEIKNQKIAIKSVDSEITYNLIQLKSIKELMKSLSIDFIDYKPQNQHNNLKMDKWIKHSDTIEFLEDLEFLPNLQAFYLNLSHEINNQAHNLDRTESLIKQGLVIRKRIGEYIENQKKNNKYT